MGSKTNCTIARDFEMLTEDAELERMQPGRGRCPCAGGSLRPGGPHHCTLRGGARGDARVTRERLGGCPQRRRPRVPEPGYPGKPPLHTPRPRFQSKVSVLDSGVSLGVRKSQSLHGHHFEKKSRQAPTADARDGARLRNPEPVGDFGSVARRSLPLRGSKHRPSGLATSGPSGQRAAGHRRL